MGYLQLCRCNCGLKYSVEPLLDQGIELGCNNCTRNFCIDKAGICQDLPEDTVITAACFQRESVKDQVFIYSFVAITSALLIYATVTKFSSRFRRQ